MRFISVQPYAGLQVILTLGKTYTNGTHDVKLCLLCHFKSSIKENKGNFNKNHLALGPNFGCIVLLISLACEKKIRLRQLRICIARVKLKIVVADDGQISITYFLVRGKTYLMTYA